MKINWTYALVFLLCLFGTFYFTGTFFGTQSDLIRIWITPSTDLWANLFASMIAIVVIERIIHRARIEKNQQSITYARGRIAHALVHLILSARVPSNWKNKLANPKFNWPRYIHELRDSRNHTLEELENILDCYSHLLEPKLMNDIFVLVSVLRSPIFDLADATSYSVTFISESKKLIECHELLKHMGTIISFRKGESPKVSLGKSGIYEPTQYRYYSEWLEEAITFRDEFREKYGIKGLQKKSKFGHDSILD